MVVTLIYKAILLIQLIKVNVNGTVSWISMMWNHDGDVS